jgi:hypothetical protein
MKHFIAIITLLLITVTAGAQSINVHKTDGTVVTYPSSEVLYIDFTSKNKDALSCPDGNHPHMIDLGLPGGTKWACCNVGANAPEKNGIYFAWGETQSKSVYDWDNYELCTGAYNCVSLGDISGTKYDVAKAHWGSPWHMPTKEQAKTLIDNCTCVTTQLNNIEGFKLTGPNGNSIFFPATGCYSGSTLRNEGSYGYYWTSTEDSKNRNQAYYLHFGEGFALWNCFDARIYGYCIRPVR